MAKTKNKGIGQGIGGGQPLKFNSCDELIEYANNYFKWCEDNGKRPTVSRLADYLDVDRSLLVRYEKCMETDYLKRLSDEERKMYSYTVKKLKRRIEAEYEDLLFEKQSNTGAIFTLKNNYNWTDKREIITEDKNSLSDISEEELNKKLSELSR